MGNKSGKVCIDGNTYSYEVEDVDEFLVIHAVEKVEGGAGDNSSSKDDGPTETDRLEESMDSGYVDVSAIQSRECSPEPAAQDEQDCDTRSKEKETHTELQDEKLGQHRSYFGYRFYQYDCEECEGNRHITNEDL